MLALRRDEERVRFSVRVTPGASANSIAGVRDGVLLVRVTAPPLEGRANEAVIATLAKALGLTRSAITIERGAAARTKRVSVPRAAEPSLARLK